MILPSYDLRKLCIKRQWFTSGSIRQYEKLFEANAEGWPIEKLAIIIYICSSDEWTLEDIIQELRTARKAYEDSLLIEEREDW